MDQQHKEILELDLDEHSELQFKVVIEGAGEPAKVRLVCEGPEVTYMFNGYATSEQDIVQFNIPEMKNKMNEGIYESKVEVMIGNKYFSPVEFDINFKQVEVFAETVVHKTNSKIQAPPLPKKIHPKPQETKVNVSAIPVVVNKSKQRRKTNSLEESRKKRMSEKEAYEILINGKSKEELKALLKNI